VSFRYGTKNWDQRQFLAADFDGCFLGACFRLRLVLLGLFATGDVLG
jgi:hypothetical protein